MKIASHEGCSGWGGAQLGEATIRLVPECRGLSGEGDERLGVVVGIPGNIGSGGDVWR